MRDTQPGTCWNGEDTLPLAAVVQPLYIARSQTLFVAMPSSWIHSEETTQSKT